MDQAPVLQPSQANLIVAQPVSNDAGKFDYKLHTLEKNNYIIWKPHMKNILEVKGLLSTIQQEDSDPQKERQARALLTSALSTDNQMKVINCVSAFKIWSRLEAIYDVKPEGLETEKGWQRWKRSGRSACWALSPITLAGLYQTT